MDNAPAEHRRLAILKLLKVAAGYRMGDELMQEALGRLGQGAALSVVRAEFAWLAQVGLVAVQELPGCHVAILRKEGLDAAAGLSSVPGVHRPAPEA